MAVDVSRSRIADPSLAPAGEQRIAWVARHSPVLNGLARARLADGALRDKRVAVVVHLEAKTAYLASLLAEAGAEVVAAGPNTRTTPDAGAAAPRPPRDRGDPPPRATPGRIQDGPL